MTLAIWKSAAPPDEEWPDLVPLNTPILPRLDTTWLPAWAGDFARALSASTETPPELAAGMVMAICATAAARRLNVKINNGYLEPCNLWFVVALPPGNRKSAIVSAAASPLVDWERQQRDILAPKIRTLTSDYKTMEARTKELRTQAAREKDEMKAREIALKAAELEDSLPVIPAPPQLWTSDATPERLGSLLVEQNECMGWLSSEGGVFDLLQGRYSNGIPNLDLILKAHSGDAERVDRGSRSPVILHNPRLSFGLSPQPDVLRGLAAKPGFRGRGLLGRFLYLLPPSPLGFRKLAFEPIPIHVRQSYEEGLQAMLNWSPVFDESGREIPHPLVLSDSAFKAWHDFALSIETRMKPGGDLEQYTDWAGKAPGAAARIAGVLHGIRHAHETPWQHPITTQTMIEALKIMEVITHHTLAAFNIMGADHSMAAAFKVLNWIKRSRLSRFTIRKAFNELRGSFPRVADLRNALDTLEERAYIKIIELPKDGPGRPPSPQVLVRKDIFDEWQ